MALEITGKIIEINPTMQVSERFKKRIFILDITEETNGQTYTNYASLQASQNKCEVLDGYKVGDEVKVSFNVRGNRWEKDGKVNYITTLDAWRIERIGNQTQSNNAAPQNNAGYSQGDAPF